MGASQDSRNTGSDPRHAVGEGIELGLGQKTFQRALSLEDIGAIYPIKGASPQQLLDGARSQQKTGEAITPSEPRDTNFCRCACYLAYERASQRGKEEGSAVEALAILKYLLVAHTEQRDISDYVALGGLESLIGAYKDFQKQNGTSSGKPSLVDAITAATTLLANGVVSTADGVSAFWERATSGQAASGAIVAKAANSLTFRSGSIKPIEDPKAISDGLTRLKITEGQIEDLERMKKTTPPGTYLALVEQGGFGHGAIVLAHNVAREISGLGIRPTITPEMTRERVASILNNRSLVDPDLMIEFLVALRIVPAGAESVPVLDEHDSDALADLVKRHFKGKGSKETAIRDCIKIVNAMELQSVQDLISYLDDQ